MTTTPDSNLAPAHDELRAVLAFYRLARSLRNTDLNRDITWERLSTLSAVARRGPITISDLSAAEEVTAPTISRAVAALQNQSLVKCVPNRDDGRSVLVTSTAKGRAALQKNLMRTVQQIADLLARLDAAELDAMVGAIQQARDTKGAP